MEIIEAKRKGVMPMITKCYVMDNGIIVTQSNGNKWSVVGGDDDNIRNMMHLEEAFVAEDRRLLHTLKSDVMTDYMDALLLRANLLDRHLGNTYEWRMITNTYSKLLDLQEKQVSLFNRMTVDSHREIVWVIMNRYPHLFYKVTCETDGYNITIKKSGEEIH